MPENKNTQNKKLPLKFFIWEVFLFSLTLFLGIASAIKMNKILEIQQIYVSSINIWQFLLYFIIGTLFILIISFFIKSKPRKGKIFKVLFIFVIFWGGIIILDLWIGNILSGIGSIISLVFMVFLIFLWLKKSSILIHNLCMILGICGAGITLGLKLEPKIMIILLIIFSVYDYIAVYKTKHMIKMAKEMIEHQAILALIIPQKISDFKENLKEVKAGGNFLVLGGGDIVFPLLFCSSFVRQDILSSLIMGIFSVIGLIFSFLIFAFQKTRKPIPALPPIALFLILGYLIILIA